MKWIAFWMKKRMMAALFGCLLSFALPAQEARVSEKELEIQSALIDAQRERLLGNAEKAEVLLKALSRKYPENDAIAYTYAQSLAETEQLTDALREIRRARRLAPDIVWYALTEGHLLEQAGYAGEAAELYRQLAARYPQEEQHYVQWAFFLIKDGRPAEAIQVYERLEKQLGHTLEISRWKYMLYRGMGKAREAAAELEAVLQRQPGNTEVMYELAEFYAENGAADDAMKWYNTILRLHPGESRARLALVSLQNQTGPDSTSLQGLTRIFQDPGADLDQKIKAIIPHIQEFADRQPAGLGEQLWQLARDLDAAHPQNPKVASILGDLSYYQGDLTSALTYYQQATSGDLRVWAVWDQLLQTCSESRSYGQQLEWAERATERFPNQARALYFLVEAYVEKGLLTEALDAIHLARLMVRRDGVLLYQLAILEGRAQAGLGDPAAARRAFDQARALQSRGPEALAWQSLTESDPREACRLAAQAREARGAIDLLGWAEARCALLERKPAEARRLLLDLVQTPYTRPGIVELLGDACALNGDVNEALIHWEKVAAMGLGSGQLAEKIQSRKYIE